MQDQIDAYYWIHSDWAYFGGPRLKALGERFQLKINHRPIDLETVYARTGGIKLPYRSIERKSYRLLEMQRFREILQMPINLEPKFFCVTGRLPSWFVIAAELNGIDVADLSQAIMRAIWVEDRDAEDGNVLVDIAHQLGLPGREILQRAQDPVTETVYMRYTNEAIARGVFGAPFYYFRGEAFWGQDRIAMLTETIEKAIAR
ncbi:2-hydroxychromene-2-carboxylate isomerase [Variovorax sp. LT1R16]|uniref:2-hydroxychromene-2-carboxylate isomerase n=1 Tax=Variovorax sp. LT1R16 TaxID=3443728 RepID=UPI003F45AF8B